MAKKLCQQKLSHSYTYIILFSVSGFAWFFSFIKSIFFYMHTCTLEIEKLIYSVSFSKRGSRYFSLTLFFFAWQGLATRPSRRGHWPGPNARKIHFYLFIVYLIFYNFNPHKLYKNYFYIGHTYLYYPRIQAIATWFEHCWMFHLTFGYC